MMKWSEPFAQLSLTRRRDKEMIGAGVVVITDRISCGVMLRERVVDLDFQMAFLWCKCRTLRLDVNIVALRACFCKQYVWSARP